MDKLYAILDGDDDLLEVCKTEETAVDARVRWMDGYPDVTVEVYERAE